MWTGVFRTSEVFIICFYCFKCSWQVEVGTAERAMLCTWDGDAITLRNPQSICGIWTKHVVKAWEQQFVFIKYLLLLIIFDHYKEYSLIKETQQLGKYLISKVEQFIFALLSRGGGEITVSVWFSVYYQIQCRNFHSNGEKYCILHLKFSLKCQLQILLLAWIEIACSNLFTISNYLKIETTFGKRN